MIKVSATAGAAVLVGTSVLLQSGTDDKLSCTKSLVQVEEWCCEYIAEWGRELLLYGKRQLIKVE